MKTTNASIYMPMVTQVQNSFSAIGNAMQEKSTNWFARFCIAGLIYSTSFLSTGLGVTITYSGRLQNLGASVTQANSPYILGGYDLYSTTPPSDNSETGSNGNGAFSVGTRLTSLPNYITGITSAGANSSAGGFAAQYLVIDNPTGGTVQSGYTYVFTSSPTTEADLLSITIGTSVPSSFYIGALINTTSNGTGDDPDDLRLRQTTGGSANSGLIPTRSTIDGDADLVEFYVTGAQPGDVYTISGVESVPDATSHYHVAISGLTFSTVPEPNSGFMLLLGFAGLTSLYRFRRNQHRVSA